MKLIFTLAVSLLHTQSAHAFQAMRSELHQLHWQQSTLLAGFTAPMKESFETIQLDAGQGKTLAARLWKTDAASRGLYFVIAGTGSNGQSGLASRLAELLTALNYDAIVVANPFSSAFQKSFSSDGVVGFPEKDTTDAVAMLRAAKADYVTKYGQPRETNILGYSLGGLFAPLSALNAGDLHIKKVIALDPPVDFEYAIKQVDQMIAHLLDHEVALPSLAKDLLRVFRLAPRGLFADNSAAVLSALPQDDDENEQIIGMSFFPALQKIESNLASTWAFSAPEKRSQLHRLHSSITFMRYTGLVSIPLTRARRYAGLTLSQVLARVDLRTVLRQNPNLAAKTYVITNRDDLLVNDSMLDDLDALLPGHIRVFEAGGHCGNYWTPSFANQLAEIVNLR